MRPFLLLVLTGLPLATFAADAWPQFRGPDGQGHAESDHAPLYWSETEHIVWKTPIPGRGWSSPVVWGEQIWMTTAIEIPVTSEEHEQIKANSPVKHLELGINKSVTFHAICVDRQTGTILHNVKLFEHERPEPIHALNSYASPTPVIEAGRVWCHFGNFGTACLDTATGDVLWNERFPNEHYVGPGSSPVLYENVLILTCDGADEQYIVGIDKYTGDAIWRKDRPPMRTSDPDLKKSYSTPLVIHAAGRDQAVIPGTQWIVAYDPLTGEELWRFDHGNGFSLAPRPVHDGKLLFFCTGFGNPQLMAIDPTGKGDLSETHVKWRESSQIPEMPSPTVVDGHLYVLSENGIVSCIEPETGLRIWRARIEGDYSASLLEAAGRIYAFSQEGVTTVFSPGERFEKLAENRLDGRIMATPAVVDGAMYLRTDSALYRLE
jgi:outer membrane protein assembly factor BamB